MDVQAVAPTLASTTFSFPPATAGDAPPVAVATPPPAPAGFPGFDSGSTAAGTAPPPAPTTPGLALLPPAAGDGKGQTLSGSVAKVYNVPESSVSVSFQPAAGTNEIVTVVTDKQTGKVVVQFPSETLIALAQFFQKIDNTSGDNGAVVDKKV